jgi:RNA recognition motif-containing protein
VVAGLKVINGLAIDGSKLSVRPTCSTDLNSKTTIFIRNLTDQTSINDLLPLVSQFGLVLSAYMPVDPILKRSKGIAYVDFDTPEAASSAIEQVSLKIIGKLWTN